MLQAKSSFRKNTAVLLLIFTLAALVFSHHPLIPLGTISGVHIELSLIYFLALCSTFISLPLIWRQRSIILDNTLCLTLVTLVIYTAISILWTSNPIRGLITAGFFLLMVGFALTISLRYKEFLRYKEIAIKTLVITYTLALLWAAWQILGDLLAVDPAYTLLPAMYEGNVFGVARPTGFALEPQFLASLLLIPLAFELRQLLSGKQHRFSYLNLFVISVIFFLTLSRGAFVGLVVVLALLLLTRRHSFARYVKSLSPIIAGFFTMLLLIFFGATIRQDNISGYDGLKRTVSHISLGIINLPEHSASKNTTIQTTTKKPSANPDGYIKASTDSRLSMSQEAIRIWTKNPENFIYGIGIGGFGTSLTPPRPSAIVNNYYLELLAETGVIGFGLFATFLTSLGITLIRLKSWLLLAIVAGLFTQALFFSGNANIIHIWALIGIAIGFTLSKKPREVSPSRLVQ